MKREEEIPDNPLATIMHPRSIAIVGASNALTKMGTIQFLNLMHSGYEGEVFLLHPKEKEIFGRRVYRTAEELPYAPELAVLVLPPQVAVTLIEDFGRLGTRHAVIISGGFKETGQSGAGLEQTLTRAAGRYGLRFLGPNCIGVINAQLPFNITVSPLQGPPGHLSIVSQSGTFIGQTLRSLNERGIRLSKGISVGNEASIDMVDCLEYLEQDRETKAIGLYLECVRRMRPFLEVARRITPHKPIVAQYVGGTESGARAGRSHTGAIAGEDLLYEGLFQQAGIIRVKTIEEVFLFGHTLAAQPPLRGKHIAVLTNSGGPAAAMADTCEEHGLKVPELSRPLQERLRTHLPEYGGFRNPVDLTFQPDMKAITSTLPRLLLESEEIDGLLIHGIIVSGWGKLVYPLLKQVTDISLEEFLSTLRADLGELLEMPRRYQKPICVSSFHGLDDRAIREFHEGGLPTFDFPEKAAAAMGMLYRYGLLKGHEWDEPGPLPPIPEAALQIMHSESPAAIDENRSKKILQSYGIPTGKDILVHGLEEAIWASESIGFPVVLKACGPGILHKTERGLVHLNLMNASAVQEAFQAIRLKEKETPVLVCEMIEGEREVMVGMKGFQGAPPCVVFGLGGIFAEALRHHTLRVAPLSREDGLSMIESSPFSEILGNFRGMKPADKGALSSILIRLAHLALHFPQIKEIDLNPIIIDKEGRPKVVDALIICESQAPSDS